MVKKVNMNVVAEVHHMGENEKFTAGDAEEIAYYVKMALKCMGGSLHPEDNLHGGITTTSVTVNGEKVITDG